MAENKAGGNRLQNRPIIALPGKAALRRTLPGAALYLAVCSALVLIVVHGAASSGYFWQWYRVERVLFSGPDGSVFSSPLLRGLGMTLRIGAVSLVFALVIALLTTALRLGGGPVARSLAVAYVQLIRNTPLLVQILFVYFVLAPGWGLAAEPSAIIALSLFEGAYMSEIFRAGVLTVPRGQWEAALSLGLTPSMSACQVVLPQAARASLPPLLSESVSLIKNTSLASAISVTELTFLGKKTISDTFMSLEIWLIVAAVYLCLSLFMGGLAALLRRWLERGWARGE